MRRIEVINGAGGRRRWSLDEKAAIVEETLAPGAVVSEVARRHGLTPQQVSVGAAKPGANGPERTSWRSCRRWSKPRRSRWRAPRRNDLGGRRRSAASGIELEMAGVTVRVGADASPKAISAVIKALKGGE